MFLKHAQKIIIIIFVLCYIEMIKFFGYAYTSVRIVLNNIRDESNK